MADEPSNGELGRLINLIRGDIRDDMAQINRRLDQMVSAERYGSDKVNIDRQINDLVKVVEGMQAQRTRDNEAQAAQRSQDAAALTQTRRWLVASVIIPLVGLILPFVFFIAGGKG